MLQLADIFRDAGGAYRERYGSRMPPSHKKAMRAIVECRTAALGGQLYECDHCGRKEFSYHSCRNRHCPKCHRAQTDRWLDRQRRRLPACPYFLVTFTVPAELRNLIRSHQRTGFRILFSAAARSLFKLANDPRCLGACPGALAVLHTWTRALVYHPHVHMLVTAGGLPEGTDQWVEPRRPGFLMPGYALSRIFRATFKDGLRRAGLLASVPAKVWSKDWVVHLQHAGSGERALEYLARYVFKVALVNSRLEQYDSGRVTFRYRDNRTRKLQHATLEVHEFIARFLQHVLPARFTKVRSYGLFAPSNGKKLLRVRDALRAPATLPTRHPSPAPPDASHSEKSLDTTTLDTEAPDGGSLHRCTGCETGMMRLIDIIPRQWRSPP